MVDMIVRAEELGMTANGEQRGGERAPGNVGTMYRQLIVRTDLYLLESIILPSYNVRPHDP
jgi:hypothetical protein